MSINAKGFLSSDIIGYIAKHRAEHDETFSLAEEISKIGQAILANIRVETVEGEVDRAKLAAAMLFVRALSNFQGSLILCERGLIVEARTLARSCFETAACLAAVARHGDTAVDLMVESTIKGKKKRVNAMLSGSFAEHLGEDQLAAVEAYLTDAGNEGQREFGIEEMARQGGLSKLYIIYRALSAEAAHPNIEALERYYNEEVKNGVRRLLWGPDLAKGQMDSTILHGCCFALCACSTANDLFGNDDTGARLKKEAERYIVVMEKFGENFDAD